MAMRDQILASAQKFVQQRGFNGFSYADIANEVGIRKASLHHHFSTKADLGKALIETYKEQFEGALVSIDSRSSSALDKLTHYIDLYRSALESKRMCLGGMLASEILTLDKKIVRSLKEFFACNIDWLIKTLKEGKKQKCLEFRGAAKEQAAMILSTLQGALLMSRGTGDAEAFEQTISSLVKAMRVS